MTSATRTTTATIIPYLSYEDAPTAIEWLVSAFGFEKRLVVPGEGETIAHSELWLGDGVVMVNSDGDSIYRLRSPRALAGTSQGLCVVVADVDGHYARARAAGAEIITEPQDKDYGGRDYTARDLEGHLWTFGTYVPSY